MTPEQESAIARFFEAVERLEELDVIRSSRFLGDIGEFLCADTFGTVLADELRLPGYDGTHEGKRVQVKFNNSPTGNNINVGDPDKYEELVVILGRAVSSGRQIMGRESFASTGSRVTM